ncbi:glycosyltransferase [Vibrio barjaei]|uniref:Glycosyltransferase n=1 Tax=Vibrio barjaei TaxID=1676683 RepID=A0ABW7IDD2_9VIBR
MKKVLFLTIVPPFPNDQGNRVYTLSIMDYLVSQGFHLDALFQTGYDRKMVDDHFGNKVKVYNVKSKDYPSKEKYQNRQEIKKLLNGKHFQGYNEDVKREIFYAANHFHPFEYISDDMVSQAKKLLEVNDYEYIVCNYIYTLRVVKELKEACGEAKSIAVTHDALSTIDYQAYEYGIDTSYRACSPSTEASCLNYADKVLAISQSEFDYFESIGVKNTVLCEYNAFDFFQDNIINKDNFNNKVIFFAASGNNLNRLGFEQFLNRVWPSIYHLDSEIRMVVCGTICDHFKGSYLNVEFKGRVENSELNNLMAQASITINPAFLGTGLKIKSVESMCVGLPMVTFEEGVDGLQEYDNQAFLIANDWLDFGQKILTLMNDRPLWEHLHDSAVNLSKSRFTGKEVFKSLL